MFFICYGCIYCSLQYGCLVGAEDAVYKDDGVWHCSFKELVYNDDYDYDGD